MKTFLLILSVAISLTAKADWTQLESSDFTMAPPPSKGSEAYKRDFKILLELQESRTDEECTLSSSQKIPNFQTLYGSSELFTETEMDHVEPLVQKSMKLAERIATYFKNEYMRPRPFNVDTRIHPCVEKPAGSKAYPSSHAAMATLGACVLAKIYPARATAILAYGKFLSLLRVKVGVHHPSDVEAGQSLANDICKTIAKDKEFQEEVEEVK